MMNNSLYITQQKLMHAVWHERKVEQAASQGKTFNDWTLELARTTMKQSLHWHTRLIHSTDNVAQTTWASGEGSKAKKNRTIASIWKDWCAYCFLQREHRFARSSGWLLPSALVCWLNSGGCTETAQTKGNIRQNIEDREPENMWLSSQSSLFLKHLAL